MKLIFIQELVVLLTYCTVDESQHDTSPQVFFESTFVLVNTSYCYNRILGDGYLLLRICRNLVKSLCSIVPSSLSPLNELKDYG